MDKDNYSLPLNDKSDLYTMGKRANPTSGYARSLYHRLTGERISLDFQHVNGAINSRSLKVQANEEIAIFPNPTAQDYVNISLDQIESLAEYSVSVYNMLGKHIITQKVSSGLNKINVENEKGILIFTIVKNGKIMSTNKVVRL